MEWSNLENYTQRSYYMGINLNTNFMKTMT